MTIDLLIICAYITLIVLVGIRISRSVKTMNDYAAGGKGYHAFFVFTTLSAVLIGGGFTIGLAEKVYILGLVYVLAMWGFSFKEILVAKFLAPRMDNFKDALSAGDIMGRAYGKQAKILTGLASALVCCGVAGAQYVALGYVLNVMLGVDPLYGILFGCTVVMLYSSRGGMKSVVAIDTIHFCVLIIALPLVCILGLQKVGGFSAVMHHVPPDHLSFVGTLPLLTVIGLFLNMFFGETLLPTYVQRLLIGKDAKETTKGTYWGGILSFPFFLMIGLIGLTALTLKSDLNPHIALPYVINEVMPIGLKGFAIAGLLAVLMSSIDSFINGASVGITHDVIKPLQKDKGQDNRELGWSRGITVLLGLLSAVFALSAKSALDVLIFSYNFWTPFILVPLVAAVLGCKVTAAAFWWGASAGILATTIWFLQMGDTLFSGAIIGVTINCLVFIAVNKWHQRSLEASKEMESA